jgi:hypothetical protein
MTDCYDSDFAKECVDDALAGAGVPVEISDSAGASVSIMTDPDPVDDVVFPVFFIRIGGYDSERLAAKALLELFREAPEED